MTTFIRVTDCPVSEKADVLRASVQLGGDRIYERDICLFRSSPNSAFSYWLPPSILRYFDEFPTFETADHVTKCGMGTLDDFRFLRLAWECGASDHWTPFLKGGSHAPWYTEIYMRVKWKSEGSEVKQYVADKVGSATRKIQAQGYYFRPGLTFPRRPANTGWFSLVPAGCIFSDNGPMAFTPDAELFFWMGFLSASVPHYLMQSLMNRGQEGSGASLTYEVGIVASVPVPTVQDPDRIAQLAQEAYSLARERFEVIETCSCFVKPSSFQNKDHQEKLNRRLAEIQLEIDDTVSAAYRITDGDLIQVNRWINRSTNIDTTSDDDDSEDLPSTDEISDWTETLSWCVGVAFGRFDWRIVNGERAALPKPDPFDPLLAKSPGMLPDGAAPFHAHAGILVDDPGHKHDLAHLVEEVLARVDAPAPADARRWLQREFFPFHLRNYSKSRRKAPIYWPLATASGAYTLWVYYPSLTSQTLYTAVNDFLEGPTGKLKQVEQEAAALRAKGTRSRDENRRLEALQDLEAELIDLRDTLLRIAPTYHPNHDDGVQITAARLWPLFRHKPWQKILKDTWAKLEGGDYDWAHLALSYWPDRVREKCKTDKSLAIAHDLETLYVEPEQKAAKPRGRKKGGEA